MRLQLAGSSTIRNDRRYDKLSENPPKARHWRIRRQRSTLYLPLTDALTCEKEKALGRLREIEKTQFAAQTSFHFTDGANRAQVALAWLWAGDRKRAISLLTQLLDEPVGLFAPNGAQDPVWCPFYDEPRFTRLLDADGQP